MNKTLHKILTVDDDNDIRMIASMVLKKKGGFDVTAKPSGEQALEYLNALSADELPDLIMLDVMMPIMDGPQTLLKIRQDASAAIADIPVIFMTAKCQPDEVARLIALGAANVISKPFEATSLAQDVQNIWDAL